MIYAIGINDKLIFENPVEDSNLDRNFKKLSGTQVQSNSYF